MFLFLCINVCLHICMCTRCMSDAHRGQKMTSDLPELKLQMVWAAVWVLGTELGSLARTAVHLATELSFQLCISFFFFFSLQVSEDMLCYFCASLTVLCPLCHVQWKTEYYLPVCAVCTYPSFSTVHEAVGCFCVTVKNVTVSIGVQVSWEEDFISFMGRLLGHVVVIFTISYLLSDVIAYILNNHCPDRYVVF